VNNQATAAAAAVAAAKSTTSHTPWLDMKSSGINLLSHDKTLFASRLSN